MPPVAMMPQRRVKGAMVIDGVVSKREEGRRFNSPQRWYQVLSLCMLLGTCPPSSLGECHVDAGMSGRRSCRELYQALDRLSPRHVMF